MSKMTLNDLRPTTKKIELIHPTQGNTGIYVELVGQDSKAFRERSKALMKQRLAEGKDAKIDVDQLEKDNADLAATCVVGWDEEVFGPFSKEKAREIMGDPELTWIREQVEEAVKERTNFFPA